MLSIEDQRSRFPAARLWHALYCVEDVEVGLRAFVAVHDVSRGPGFGGIRRMPYHNDDEAVADALRLSEHMTLKTALAELPCGGAKAVIMDHPAMDLNAIYATFGKAVQELSGEYYCGPDIGTGEAEMAAVRSRAGFANPADNRPSESTATGVLAAINAALSFTGIAHPTVLVQGVGRVGSLVAQGLANRASALCVSDVSEIAVAQAQEELGATVVDPEEVSISHCQLFSPCAVGPVINGANVDTVPWAIICGATNNQLANPALAEKLHQRGVVYAPDFVVNAGAVIEGVLTILRPGPNVRLQINRAIKAIGDRTGSLLKAGAETHRSALSVALETALN